MAQTQTVTDSGIKELMSLWIVTDPVATKLMSICCLNDDTAACVASATATYTTPTDVKVTDAGLSIADITTRALATKNTDGDAIDFDHVFTASASKNVSGIIVCNDDNDLAYIECCFNALLAMESADTLTIDGQVYIDQAA